MFNKITDTIDLFRVGSEIANKGAWKQGGNAASLLAAVLVGVVKVLGDYNVINIQLDSETAASIAGGVASLVLFIVNNITSKSCGLLPAKRIADIPAEPDSDVTVDTPSVPDEAEQPMVPEAAPAQVPEQPVEPVSAAYIREARAAAIADRANQSLHKGGH